MNIKVMTAHESRIFCDSSINVRSAAEGAQTIISGLAVPYGAWTRIDTPEGGYYLEKIQRGALKDSLEDGHEISFRMGHNYRMNLGSTKSNLRLIDKPDGLYYEIVIDESTELGRRAINEVESGLIKHSSIGFRPITERWEDDWIGLEDIRTCIVTVIALGEISLVQNPAYIETTATVNRRLGTNRICSTIETARVGDRGTEFQNRLVD